MFWKLAFSQGLLKTISPCRIKVSEDWIELRLNRARERLSSFTLFVIIAKTEYFSFLFTVFRLNVLRRLFGLRFHNLVFKRFILEVDSLVKGFRDFLGRFGTSWRIIGLSVWFWNLFRKSIFLILLILDGFFGFFKQKILKRNWLCWKILLEALFDILNGVENLELRIFFDLRFWGRRRDWSHVFFLIFQNYRLLYI